jgi:hypothetical protein
METLYTKEELTGMIEELQNQQHARLNLLAKQDLLWTNYETEKAVYNQILGRVNEVEDTGLPETPEAPEVPKNSQAKLSQAGKSKQ